MMPSWVWWALITIGVFAVGWLWGRRSRPQGAAGQGPWKTSWAVYFSPHGGARNAILEAVRGTKQTILVQAYLLYSTRLAGALVRAHQRGVQVHVLLDANVQPHHPPVAAVARLVAAGIAVSLDAQHARAHDKVMILDGVIVITGSYNWTVAAEQENGENLLVIRHPRLAQVYTENWRRHAYHSMPYRPRVSWVGVCSRGMRLPHTQASHANGHRETRLQGWSLKRFTAYPFYVPLGRMSGLPVGFQASATSHPTSKEFVVSIRYIVHVGFVGSVEDMTVGKSQEKRSLYARTHPQAL